MIFYLLIVVAFGATLFYISSRVRRAAGLAFESETVETDEFVIVKPEGFINPIKDESRFAFEAYSKDFGTGENAENLRQAEIFVSVFNDKSFNAVCEEAKNAGEILPENDRKTCLIKSEETLENVSAYKFYKIIASENSQKIYELKISVLQDFLAEYQNRIDETLESFRLI
jgi:hypothetical protein